MQRNLLQDKRQTTASLIKRRIQDKIGAGSKLDGSYLQTFYESLKPVTSPDFSNLESIVREVSPSCPKNLLLSGVIVETRKHPNIKLVLENFFKHLDCPLVFFIGSENRDYVLDCISPDYRPNVILKQLSCTKLNARTYNALLLSEKFWNALASRGKILTIQVDSYISNFSDYKLHDFMAYDFVGSAYSRDRPIGIIADGGNGGLSLRDWSKTIECIKRFDPRYWRGGEDGYFNFHVDLIGGRVGDLKACYKFGTQGVRMYNSWGYHQPSLLPSNIIKEIIKKEPELAAIVRS